ncbi:occludin/ELL domain-containing protein 1 [Malurus melanocephalus]|uniref:occludin/ELL domain-containing protein 1 n=1 Tax=Malurus melanocephalus TaxID=175006 RepID=UPI00254758F4|nr:occludin/ELL domain-containing protein 1 [Malurus melanocephalus]
MRRAGVVWKRRETLGGPAVPGSGDSPTWSPPCPPERRQCHLSPVPLLPKTPPAHARRVTFEDEVVTPWGPVRSATDSAVAPKLSPRHSAVPDYVLRYPAIRSPRQRDGSKGVFQDQREEYLDLLRELRVTCHSPSTTDLSRLEKLQRCEYLKEKLTHLKARIRDYDRVTAANPGGS